jgi:hypothetical protein
VILSSNLFSSIEAPSMGDKAILFLSYLSILSKAQSFFFWKIQLTRLLAADKSGCRSNNDFVIEKCNQKLIEGKGERGKWELVSYELKK